MFFPGTDKIIFCAASDAIIYYRHKTLHLKYENHSPEKGNHLYKKSRLLDGILSNHIYNKLNA
jgi:hypothetical protein